MDAPVVCGTVADGTVTYGTVADGTVAVLGNGPVGQTTALLLARWGVRTVLLDGKRERDQAGSRSICQQRDVLDIWDSVGAGLAIADEGVTWTTARTFYQDRELFSYRLPGSGGSPFPPFVNISQSRTEQLLDQRIAAEPRIDVRWSHLVTGVTQDDGGVLVSCQTPDGSREVRADYAVACLGGHADDIRGQLGVHFGGRSFDDKFLICDIRTELPGWASERRFYFDPPWNPDRQVLIHPCPDSTFRIDWQVPADFDLTAAEASGALDARIRAVIGDRRYSVAWRSVYRFSSRVADRMRAGRVLLAGDCAHVFAPFGARGLNSGVADAENAAWKVAYLLRGWAGDGLLESYHAERHAAALENLAVTTATMDFLVPQDAGQRQRRLAALRAAVLDQTATADVDSGRLAEPFWYARSPLTTPDRSHPVTGRPERGTVPPAGPGVLLPDLRISPSGRLRAVARDGFLMLVAPGADLQAAGAAAAAASCPVRVLAMADADPSGGLAAALGARAGETWLIRPDAYVAAITTGPAHTLGSAMHRVLG